MEIVPLGPGFGAELRGVGIADVAADEDAYRQVRAAFEEHSLLVFRGQDVTDDTQLAFSRCFGPLEVTKVGALGAGTNLAILSTIDESGKVVPADHRLALGNKANQLWHTDSTFKRVPALASVLSARTIPARGGETEFVSTRLAFERLDAGLRQRSSRESFAWHDYAHSRGKIAPDLANAGGARGAAAAMLAHGVEEPASMAAARSTSPRTPMRSKAWSRRRANNSSTN